MPHFPQSLRRILEGLSLSKKVQAMALVLVLAYIFMIFSFSIGVFSLGQDVQQSTRTVSFYTTLQQIQRHIDSYRSIQLELMRSAKEMLLAKDDRYEDEEAIKTRKLKGIESTVLALTLSQELSASLAKVFPAWPRISPLYLLLDHDSFLLENLNQSLPRAIEERKGIIITFKDRESAWASLLLTYQDDLARLGEAFDLSGSKRKGQILGTIQQKTSDLLLASTLLTKDLALAYLDQKNILVINADIQAINQELARLDQELGQGELGTYRQYRETVNKLIGTISTEQVPLLNRYIDELGRADLKLWTLDFQLHQRTAAVLRQLDDWEHIILGSIGQSTRDMTQRQTVLLERVNLILGGNALLAILASVLVLVIFYFFSKSILVPVRQATSFVKALEGGDFSLRLSPRGNDEITALGRALDSMAQEVLAVNSGLEKLVQERTLELEHRLLDLREAQSSLLKSERLASMTPLLFGVAHELNTPLGTCITAASYAEDLLGQAGQTMDSGTYGQLSEALSLINRGLGRSSDLIRNFKGLAILQNQDTAKLTTIGVLCQEVLGMLGELVEKQGVRTSIAGNLELQARVVALPLKTALEQAIRNGLVHGVRKEPGREDTLNIDIFPVDADYFAIRISDSGYGMTEDNLKKAFEPFFTTGRNQGMAGLGLYLVHNIVSQQLHGRVTLEHNSNGGMALDLILPLDSQAS